MPEVGAHSLIESERSPERGAGAEQGVVELGLDEEAAGLANVQRRGNDILGVGLGVIDRIAEVRRDLG